MRRWRRKRRTSKGVFRDVIKYQEHKREEIKQGERHVRKKRLKLFEG